MLASGLSGSDAEKAERHYIFTYASSIDYWGYNLTSGGNGVKDYKFTDRDKALISKKTKEGIAKVRGTKFWDEHRARMGHSVKHSPLWQERHAQVLQKRNSSIQHIAMLKKLADDPEHRKKISDGVKAAIASGKIHNPEHREKIKTALKAYYSSETGKAAASARAKKMASDPVWRTRHAAMLTVRNKSPDHRAKLSRAFRGRKLTSEWLAKTRRTGRPNKVYKSSSQLNLSYE